MKKAKKNLPGRRRSGKALLEAIEAACDGLIYVSETDAPVVPFGLDEGAANDDVALRNLGARPGENVEELSFETFFARLTATHDWFGTAEIARAAQFARLQDLLAENLIGLRVIRIGSIDVTVLIGGRDSKGHLMGVRTRAVET